MASSSVYTNVWVLITPNRADCLLTNSGTELNSLVGGGSYQQVCTPYGGTTDFCVNGSMRNAATGPFIIFSSPVQVLSQNVLPLYRCLAPENGHHFFSLDPNCEGYTTEYLLGYISPVRVGEMPRALYRCYDASTFTHYPSLDLPCPAGQSDGSIFGYVR